LSIREAARQIARVNKRQKAGGTYLDQQGLTATLIDAYQPALERAALEAFEGRYEEEELAKKVQQEKVVEAATELILMYQSGAKI
jgi:hypothetical protein